jgi:hypothetical protein
MLTIPWQRSHTQYLHTNTAVQRAGAIGPAHPHVPHPPLHPDVELGTFREVNLAIGVWPQNLTVVVHDETHQSILAWAVRVVQQRDDGRTKLLSAVHYLARHIIGRCTTMPLTEEMCCPGYTSVLG